MASGSIFSGTLQTITNAKLEELSKQHQVFQKQHAALIAAANAESDPLQRLNKVVDGTKRCLGVKTSKHKDDESRPGRVISGSTRDPRLEIDLKTVDRFLDQARFDPSVSSDILKNWEEKFVHYVTVQATKYEYADLYGKLVTEWLSFDKAAKADGDDETGESFQEFPSAKKLEARKKWEESVFEPASVDVPALRNYLEHLFVVDKKNAASALSNLRKRVADFEKSLTHSSQFNAHTLRWIIRSLQTSDLLSNEKREVLRDFLSNDIILSEIADVLNTRMEALDRWSWGDYVLLEQQRQVNGQFQVQMQEDVLQAIFLHYIGVKWSVFFKKAFLNLRNDSKMWKSNIPDIPQSDHLRRGYFLGATSGGSTGTLDQLRSNIQRNRYFTNQLLTREEQQVQHNDGEEEADYAEFVSEKPNPAPASAYANLGAYTPYSSGFGNVQPEATDGFSAEFQPIAAANHASGASLFGVNNQQAQPTVSGGLFGGFKPTLPAGTTASRSMFAPSYQPTSPQYSPVRDEYGSDEEEHSKNPMDAKQSLLHILAAEIMLNTHLNGEISCFRTTFESWNSLLPHETVLVILEFLGVSDTWKFFFRSFLEVPLKFAEDHESSEPRSRRRGTPDLHALSDVFGEVVLFCLDFSINQSTKGALLHRMQDDLWFWNRDFETCAEAWTTIQDFADVTGTQIDNVKSGSIRVTKQGSKEIDDRLPRGDIRWGFLYLNPSNGRFDIDHKMVDSHVKELRQQLQGKPKSVIDWVQTWNSYATTFFTTNFGKPATCFGREHIDTMLATHRRIQESVFSGSNVVQQLKQMIADRFGVSNIPDGFLYFPVELGGLDLQSPFVGLLQIRESVRAKPYDLLKEFEEKELDDYNNAKQHFEKDILPAHLGQQRDHPFAKVQFAQPTIPSAHQVQSTTLFGQPQQPKAQSQPTNDPFGNKPFRPTDGDTFFPLSEYTQYRESHLTGRTANLRNVFLSLLKRPIEAPVEASPQITHALSELQGKNLRGILKNWGSMDAYWKWIAQMYGPDMVTRFGGLNVVDPGWLPIGMVSQFRQRRMKWQG